MAVLFSTGEIFESNNALWYTSSGALEETENGKIERSTSRELDLTVSWLDQVNALRCFSHKAG